MDQKLEFSFKGQVVGFFEEPNYPRTAGRYRYMPYRGPGHRDMQVALESGTVRCSFKDGFTSYEFMVSSVPESHVLSIDTVRRRRFSPIWKVSAMRRIPARWILIIPLAVVHIAIVSSILLQERSVIWPLHNDTVHRRGPAGDFYAVYHAGFNVSHGMNPYENDAKKDRVTPYWYFFRYLPVVATAGRVFTVMTPHTAYVVWVLIVEACLAVLLYVLWRTISDLRLRIATISLLLLNSPYFLELHMGQFTFVALTLCCFAVLHPRGGRPGFTVSVLLKPLCLVTVPALARERRYWLTSMIAIACLLVFSVPYFIRHPDQWATFYEANFMLRGGLTSGNYGFVYFLSLLANDWLITPLLYHWDGFVSVFRLVLLAGTAVMVFHSRKGTVTTGVAALILAHFLTYQHVWEHHMSGVCVVAAMLLTVPDGERWKYVAILSCLFLLAIPSPFALLDTAKDPTMLDPSMYWPRYASYLTVLSEVLPTAALFAIVMRDIFRGGFVTPRRAIETAWRGKSAEPAVRRGQMLAVKP